MTTVVAKKNANGTVDLGWDSLVSPSQGAYPKVAQVNEQFWFGGAGRLRFLNIVQAAEVPTVHPAEYSAEEFEPLQYLVTAVVPAWMKALKEARSNHPDPDEESPLGTGLVIMKGRIFQVGFDFAVMEAPGHYGIGSGADFALGALASGKSVEKALGIAAELDPYTGGTIRVLKGLK